MEERYSRHISLKGFGQAGQEKLLRAKVLVIGAGGLGCPALQYLAAAGTGTLGIVDHDVIELSNLQRQVLYSTGETGLPKAEVAAAKLRSLNPEIEIREEVLLVSAQNVVALIEPYDVILDCSDNFATRYLLCDACSLLDKPLIFGAIYQYEGQLAVFNVPDREGVKTSYRHLFPSPPDPWDAPDCNVAGVLGVLPGIIGILQATEAIKLLTGVGEVLCNKLMTVNLSDNRTLILDVPQTVSEEVSWPTSPAALEVFDYEAHCGLKRFPVRGIGPEEFIEITRGEDVMVIDVRNRDEMPELPVDHTRIPLPDLPDHLDKIHKEKVIVVCQLGKRSRIAGQLLHDKIGQHHRILHLEGGVEALPTE